jgi:dCMP deaminase
MNENGYHYTRIKPIDRTWDEYFMGIAEAVSHKSHCLSHKFGAIAVTDDHQIVSTGYNGPPRGYTHCNHGFMGLGNCPRRVKGYKSGEGLEWCPAAHAERNVLINAARYGVRLNGCALYVTSPVPCRECAKEIVNAGIQEVIYKDEVDYPETGITGKSILFECGVKLRWINAPGPR